MITGLQIPIGGTPADEEILPPLASRRKGVVFVSTKTLTDVVFVDTITP
jgi:hypothetical protein